MYPEFTINGIEYKAERFYSAVHGIPVATIRCSVKLPEDFEPDVPEKRKNVMKLLNLGLLLGLYCLIIFGIIVRWEGVLSTWEGCFLLISFGILALMMIYRAKLLHFNEKQ